MYVNGYHLRCPHCGGEEFERIGVSLDTDRSSFLGFDWADEGVRAFSCRTCGRMEWFRNARITETDRRGKPADCTRCGILIGATHDFCPNCGEPK